MKSLTQEEIKTSFETLLQGQYLFAVLLGSAATPRFYHESDIDLAVYFKKTLSFEELSQFTSKLSDKFELNCDLINLNKIDPIFARQVIETGRELSIIDPSFFNIWKAEQMSRYPDFKRSRKIIEDNLLNRKKYV